MKKIIVGITGASGSIYSKRLIDTLLQYGHDVVIVATETGEKVFNYELADTLSNDSSDTGGFDFRSWVARTGVSLYENSDLFAPPASGSSRFDAMVVIPCSMGTLGRIAGGMSNNLLERSADVMLKEGRNLVIVPRETPLSLIHLRNMTTVAQAGATIVPAMPSFYQKPKTIDDLVDSVVARVLDQLSIDHNLSLRWDDQTEK